MMKREIVTQMKTERFKRKLSLENDSVDDDARTIDASLSSEYPVERFFGTEVLRHTKESVNLERVGDKGLPLLFGHDDRTLVGRARNVRVENGRLRARLHFSKNTKKARETWAEIRDGFLGDISIGYEINEIDEADDLVTVTRFTPFEASIVPVPADPTVGINRSKKEDSKTMKPEDKNTDGGGDELKITDFQAAREKAAIEGREIGAKLERERVAAINRVYSMHMARAGVAELQAEAIAKGTSAAAAAIGLLEFMAGNPEPLHTSTRQSEGSHGQHIETIRDESDKWTEGVTEALELRGNLIQDKEKARAARIKNEFGGVHLAELARDYLRRQHMQISGMNRQQIAGLAFTRAPGMHSTSDFANILENVANKAMLLGYNEQPETWNIWARTGSISDFRPASRVNISTFSELQLVVEGGEYKEGHFSDLKEQIQLLTYGRLFHITRETITNDDVGAFTSTPQQMGRKAATKVGDLAYDVLTVNATLNQDGVALFDTATHANLASSGAVISEATLDAARNAMATQKGPAPGTGETGASLNIRGRYLIIPSAIEMAARKVVESVNAPDTTGDLTINTVRGRYEVVSDARLDDDSITQWYIAADPRLVDTVEVAFLDGNDQPYLESQNAFYTDGIAFKVRIDAAAAALDFRGMYSNPGA